MSIVPTIKPSRGNPLWGSTVTKTSTPVPEDLVDNEPIIDFRAIARPDVSPTLNGIRDNAELERAIDEPITIDAPIPTSKLVPSVLTSQSSPDNSLGDIVDSVRGKIRRLIDTTTGKLEQGKTYRFILTKPKDMTKLEKMRGKEYSVLGVKIKVLSVGDWKPGDVQITIKIGA